MHRLALEHGAALLVAMVGAIVTACGSDSAPTEPSHSPETVELRRYTEDPSARRDALERSLVVHTNGYAQLRLRNYTEEGWGALPEWNPEVRRTSSEIAHPLDIQGGWADADLVELGRRAFFDYPVQVASGRAPSEVPRSVRTRLADGREIPSFTCASCHASFVDGALVAGRNDPDLVIGAFPPGRVDVTGDGIDDPIAIPDLRGVRWQPNLHHAATWDNGLAALAVRIETLIITGLGSAVRPPRRVSAALAFYLWDLGKAPPAPPPTARGASVFARECSRCHAGPGHSGAAVPLEIVGTDPLVGLSPDRGTGRYRVPSLVHVGDRRRLFASGAVADIVELLDPNRRAQGHVYGLALSNEERDDLLAYLRAL